MPKENIHSVSDAANPALNAEVSWSREAEYVQLGTVNPDENATTEDCITNGWFVTLDRVQINRLIRVLRRARDQAFGADA